MDEVTQIRVGQHLTGIIGLKAALSKTVKESNGIADDRIGKILLEKLSKQNYIPDKLSPFYEEAFVREYKKYIGLPVIEAPDEFLHIKILGQGCPQCDKLEKELMAVMSEMNIVADLEHVRDLKEIGSYGVMGMPALIINGTIKSVGKVPTRKQLQSWLREVKAEK